jgi:predicted 3-demethylubiquinone-9 3-methyltransferase (glyoxalase superfamily)
MANIQKTTPFLWFDHQAEEAANFYTSVFGNSKIDNITRHNEMVLVVDFSLNGQKFNAMNAGPRFKFNPSISFLWFVKPRPKPIRYGNNSAKAA